MQQSQMQHVASDFVEHGVVEVLHEGQVHHDIPELVNVDHHENLQDLTDQVSQNVKNAESLNVELQVRKFWL